MGEGAVVLRDLGGAIFIDIAVAVADVPAADVPASYNSLPADVGRGSGPNYGPAVTSPGQDSSSSQISAAEWKQDPNMQV